MTVHKLKCWVNYFNAIADGSKTYELRFDDRGYQVGDILELVCVSQDSPHVYVGLDGFLVDWSDRVKLRKRVTYISHGGQWGLQDNWVCLALGEDDSVYTQEELEGDR